MTRVVNLIPMAGRGQRFLDAGYKTPKPLIPVHGTPMAVRAARCLPEAGHWIFVCQRAHLDQYPLEETLRKHFEGAAVLALDGPNEGQACTCLAGGAALAPDDLVHIGSSDNAMTYSQQQLGVLVKDAAVDGLVWTFRDNPAVLQDVKMYGWVRVDGRNTVLGVSVKEPISDNPTRDHAVIGAFTFKRAEVMRECIKKTMAAGRRINNEFYMDEVINVAVEQGFKIKVFEVNRYICWGTPADLGLYCYWHDYFQEAGLA